MSNIAGKAYAMNVVTPSKPYLTWINRLIFMVSRGLPSTLGGLLGLSLIHYARWVIIRRDQWPGHRAKGAEREDRGEEARMQAHRARRRGMPVGGRRRRGAGLIDRGGVGHGAGL